MDEDGAGLTDGPTKPWTEFNSQTLLYKLQSL